VTVGGVQVEVATDAFLKEVYAAREAAKAERRRVRRRELAGLVPVDDAPEAAVVGGLPKQHTEDHDGDGAERLPGTERPDDKSGHRERVDDSEREHGRDYRRVRSPDGSSGD